MPYHKGTQAAYKAHVRERSPANCHVSEQSWNRSPTPIKFSDLCSHCQHYDCHFMRDPEPWSPSQESPEFLIFWKCEKNIYFKPWCLGVICFFSNREHMQIYRSFSYNVITDMARFNSTILFLFSIFSICSLILNFCVLLSPLSFRLFK